MKIDFAMLTTKEVLRLRLLTYIEDQQGHFNLTDFATSAEISYSRAYHSLLNLRTELQQLDAATTLTKDALETTVTVDEYRHWLYQHSLP